MNNNTFKHKFLKVLNGTTLNEQQKLIIKERYLNIVASAETHYRFTSWTYIIFTNLVALCGVFITAFVSFDRITTPSNSTTNEIVVSQAFLWVVWGLGILLAVVSELSIVFNIPKKYIINAAILEKLYSEGWSFAIGTGRYDKFNDMDSKFKLFCERIEKIKLKAIGTMQDDGGRNDVDEILSSGFDDSGRGKLTSQTVSRRSKKLIFRTIVKEECERSIAELKKSFRGNVNSDDPDDPDDPDDNIESTESTESLSISKSTSKDGRSLKKRVEKSSDSINSIQVDKLMSDAVTAMSDIIDVVAAVSPVLDSDDIIVDM